MEYFAHISEDGKRKQTVSEHLHGTAELCKAFAATFGDGSQGYLLGLIHDIGKNTPEFQRRLEGGARVDHSSAGAKELLMQSNGNCVWGALCVAGHHGGLLDLGNQTDGADADTLWGRMRRVFCGSIPAYYMNMSLPPVEKPVHLDIDRLSDSFIIRMLFSCLVDADFLDTEAFMQNGGITRSGFSSIPELLDKLNNHISKWENPANELNKVRSLILSSCISAGKADKGIFTLTVPTGGGKTVSSLAFALNHAVAHGMQRVIYVVPYTSIIEQNAKVFREILGAENVIEHHSNVKIDDDKNDITPEKQRIMLATENWDAPIIVTTAVQFFESMYSNKVSVCRKLHNIANSVIVFDEAQMIPVNNLRPCVAAMTSLTDHFNSTVVLCTATQPSLGKLIEEFAPDQKIREICPNELCASGIFRRVTFDIRTDTSNSIEDTVDELNDKIAVLCVVNKRKTAQKIYELLDKEGRYHLSTYMCPEHRRRVIDEIKARLKKAEVCRVVSTSLIEAGVDVDFECVYRETAGLDSVLQAAGRCNREGKRPPEDSIVTVFRLDELPPAIIQKNIGAANEAMQLCGEPDKPETIKQYFESLMDFTSNMDNAGVIDAFREGIQGCEMPFRTVGERFRMIESNTRAVYIPFGEGEELIHRLNNGERSRKLFRELGHYAVNLYEEQFSHLLSEGSIVILPDCDCAILVNKELYSNDTGLKTDANSSGFYNV